MNLSPPQSASNMEAMEEAPWQYSKQRYDIVARKMSTWNYLVSDYNASFFFLVWWTCLYPGWVSHSRSCSGAQHHVKTSLVHAVERVTWNAWPSAAFTASDKDGWVTLRKCKFFVFSHVRLELLRKREKTRQQQTLCREKFSSFPAELYHFISTTAPQKARLN